MRAVHRPRLFAHRTLEAREGIEQRSDTDFANAALRFFRGIRVVALGEGVVGCVYGANRWPVGWVLGGDDQEGDVAANRWREPVKRVLVIALAIAIGAPSMGSAAGSCPSRSSCRTALLL